MSVGGIRQLVVQNTSMDELFMEYWMAGQVRTMLISVMQKSKLWVGRIILRRVLMTLCEMLFRDHFRNTSIIAMLGSGRGRVGGLGDVL